MSLGRDRDVVGLPSATFMNRLMEHARRLSRLALGDGIRLEHTPAGRNLSLDRPDVRFPAKLLSGPTGGPYLFRRVRLLPDGTWSELVARDDPAVAYDSNLQSVSLPRIVLLRDVGLAGEYRSFAPRNAVPGLGTISCQDCFETAGDLMLRVRRRNDVAETECEDFQDVVLHKRSNPIFSIIPGAFTRPGPYWYTDPVPVCTSTVYSWSRYFFWCGHTNGSGALASLYQRTWPSEEAATDALVFGEITDQLSAESTTQIEFGVCPRASCTPVYAIWEGIDLTFREDGLGYIQTESIHFVVSGPGADPDAPPPLPPLVRQVNLTVRTPRCPGHEGSLVSGSHLEFIQDSSLITLLDITTDSGGSGSVTVTESGVYTARATLPSGCVHEKKVTITECGGVGPVELTPCCAQVPFRILDDDNETPLEDAVIVLPDGSEFVTDSAGEVTVNVPTELMLLLSLAGTDCDVRSLPFTVSRPTGSYLSFCTEIEVACGQTGGTVQEFTLATRPPNTILWETCCVDLGCIAGGPANRGLLWTLLDFTYLAEATRGLLSWSYLFEGQAALIVDGLGNPSLGELGGLLYRSECLSGLFITPAVEGCEEGQRTTYVSARFEIEMCLGGPPHLRIRFYQRTSCDNTGQTESETPACDTDVFVDQDIPTSVQSMCVGTSLFQEWTQSITDGSIDHSLSLTGASTP